jgi:outer membrane protein OmpA-like peptidoglycan-associated protein
MKTLLYIRHFQIVVATLAMAALIGLALSPAVAEAQSAPSFNYGNTAVTVDLSVIEDGGYGPSRGLASPNLSFPGYSGQRLLMPGSGMPTSRLHHAVPEIVASPAKPTAPSAQLQPPTKPQSMAAPNPPKAAPKPKVIVETSPPPPPAAKPKPRPAADKAPPPPPSPAVTAKETPPVPPPAVTAKDPPRAASNPREQASRPPAHEATLPGRALRLIFAGSAAKISPEVQTQLKSLAGRLGKQTNLRLHLMSYAGGKKLSSSKARRLSLSRALSVRAFLIKNGVRSTRIDVRALGNKATDEPLNRVDVMVVTR